jgi:hypothetical protein
MASDHVPSHFLILPNEIIHSVFDYFSTTDLIVSFGHLTNNRIHGLLTSHISPLNLNFINSSSFGWLSQHLPVVRQHVKRISIDIEFVEKLFEVLPVLDALTIRYDEDTQHLIDRFVTLFQKNKRVHIGALTLSTYDGVIQSKTAELLLNVNGQLPEHTLIIDSSRLLIDIHRLIASSQPRHVHFRVQEENVFHALCAHMPNLETIEIAFMSSGLQTDMSFFENSQFLSVSSERDDESVTRPSTRYPKYKPKDKADEITVVAPARLRSIFIKGHIATFDRLSRLFELASTSLTTIKMKVWAYSIIDTEQINNVAPHINFQFDIYYDMIGVPSDFDWQNYIDRFTQRPALRCHDEMFCNLSSVINRSVFWLQTTAMCVTSPQLLCFPQVHTLKFQYCKITMNTEKVKFIRKTFPQMRRLVWRLSQPEVTTKIPLDMVNTLVVHSSDRKTLGSLFLLCPNVNRISFTLAIEKRENLPELEDTRIHDACKQIIMVQLVPKDKMEKEQMNKLFPNACITYNATPFYEQMY